jgi:YD repeat-containing protein
MKSVAKIIVLFLLGFMVTVAAVQAGSVSYTYDGAGRLIAADFEDKTFYDYTYDNAGNLLSKTTGTAVLGDTFPDQIIDLADAIVALQVTAGTNPLQVSLRGEIDEDNRVGLPEAVFILRTLALGN